MLAGVDVAGILNGVLARDSAPATLIKEAAGTRTPGNYSAGTNPTGTSYPAKGWVDVYNPNELANTLIRQNDRKLCLLARSISGGVVPSANDRVTMTDLDGTTKTFTIIAVTASGPQGAVFICQGRS